jgi:hypothetical protein
MNSNEAMYAIEEAWPRKFFSVKVADDFFLKVFGFVFPFVFC